MTTKMTGSAKVTRTGLGLAAALAGLTLVGGVAAATQTTEGLGGLVSPAGEERGTARVMGMDATYVGVAEGAAALQWNPAGLGNMQAMEAGWHHVSGLDGAIGETIILGMPIGPMGGLAVSARLLDNGSFDSRDSMGNPTGQYDARAIGGSVGWGYPLMKDLAAGAAIRGSRQTLGTANYDSFAGDVGVLWHAFPAVTFGAAVANLGTSGTDSSLAIGIRAGASWIREYGANNHLLLAAATEIQPGGLNRMNIGAEGMVLSRLALRAGYRLNFTDQQLTGLTALTLGAGVSFSNLVLDYAYLPFGELGTLHQISLTFRKATPARVEAATPAPVEPVAQVAQPVPVAPAPVAAAPVTEASSDTVVHEITECGFSCGWAAADVLKVTLFDDKTKFDFDSDTIRPDGLEGLKRLAVILNRYPESTLQVDGYSDSRGTEAIKMRMSLLRAQNVARRLQQLGVAASRFESVNGKSDTDPIASNAGDAGRASNRRVELLVHRLKAQ